MAEVVFKNVKKIYEGNVLAVRNATFTVNDKEFVILVGPSGCGKSTTLRMVAGLEEITSGEIYISGTKVNDIPPKDRDIAMVFQNYALYPHMTVYKNMAFGLKLRKFPKSEIDERVNEAAEILGIQELLERKPKALSGGQRQRVAVGRAIVRKPKVFLFDEPLSNLDAKLRVQMRTELSKLHSRLGTTMIYVTHDQVEAMTMGDRIVVMKDGDILQIDKPIPLYNNPTNKFVAGFIGSPSMNFINGKILKMDGGLVFDEGNFKIEITIDRQEMLHNYIDQEVILGVRPENIFDAHYNDGAHIKKNIKAKVEVIEPMGNDILINLTTGKTLFIARVDPRSKPEIEKEMELTFDASKFCFFDVNDEKKIA